jgi:hypothetical protein
VEQTSSALVADAIVPAVAAVDRDEVRRTYWDQNEFICVERWLPQALVERMLAEVERVRPAVHRNYIPGHKKGGSVSAYTLAEHAPTIVALYRSPAFIELLRDITGQALQPCPPRDPHAFALYFYTEPGDHIGLHLDSSYYRGRRYTVLLGLVDRSSSRLVCQLFKDDPRRLPPVEVRVATEPGTIVLFNGDRLWHAITPLGPDEERVSLTFEYVTDPSMSAINRFVSDMKDAIAYFGFRTVFGARRPLRA